MRLILFAIIVFVPTFLMAQSEDCHCFKPVFEIGLGPQWTLPVIKDYEVGIVTNSKPSAQAILNYTFHLGIHTHPSAFQAGLEIIQDRKKFNVYLPLFWPSQEKSQWDHIYTSYRLGLGANVRYHIGNFYLQAAASFMNEISTETQVILHEPGAPSRYFDDEYTADSGWLLNATIGYILTPDGRLSTSLNFGFDTAEHEFNNDQYVHHWTVRNNMIGLMINYQLNNNP